MSRQLYFECASGISGDMTVAALLDLGASEQALKDTLATLPIEEPYEIQISRVKKSGLDVCDFLVELPEDPDFQDHDMEYLHGHEQESHVHEAEEPVHAVHGDHDHAHAHVVHDGHAHAHVHTHAHHGRGPTEIRRIFDASGMSEGARKIAGDVLDILGEAEARAHGTEISQVHFHEAGAVDSIIDIAAAAICLDDLKRRYEIEEIIVTELAEGRGSVRCQHGVLPIPVPAVTEIISRHHLRMRFLPVDGELVTPTGAAIAAAVATSDALPKAMKVLGCGMGAGKRSYSVPEILRVFLVETGEKTEDEIYKLETNIDDCSGEALGRVMQRLFELGAKDVSYTPVFMKKNRPAYELHVICDHDRVSALEEAIFRETTTIGIRRCKMERTTLPRKICRVQTSLGEAAVKICRISGDGDLIKIYPEYESVAALADKNDLSWGDAYHRIIHEATLLRERGEL